MIESFDIRKMKSIKSLENKYLGGTLFYTFKKYKGGINLNNIWIEQDNIGADLSNFWVEQGKSGVLGLVYGAGGDEKTEYPYVEL